MTMDKKLGASSGEGDNSNIQTTLHTIRRAQEGASLSATSETPQPSKDSSREEASWNEASTQAEITWEDALETQMSSEQQMELQEDEMVRLVSLLRDERIQKDLLAEQLDDSIQKIKEVTAENDGLRTELSSSWDDFEIASKKQKDRFDQTCETLDKAASPEGESRSVQARLHMAQAKFGKSLGLFKARTWCTKDLTQRLYTQNGRLIKLLDRLSYSVTRKGNSMIIQKIPRTERSSAQDSSEPGSSMRRSISVLADKDLVEQLNWMQNEDSETEAEKYEAFLKGIGYFDIEAFCETITKRVKDIEHTTRKYTKDARAYREKYHHAQKEAHEKIAFKKFKEGDLALFLPTRNQISGAWAAFNVGAPHYFLREQDSHKLRTRDWLLARIQKIEDYVVGQSKSINGHHSNVGDRDFIGEASNGGDSFKDDNPFDLSDGLRWHFIDAVEEKPGAPSTPELDESTTATISVDATSSIRETKKSSSSGVDGISKTVS